MLFYLLASSFKIFDVTTTFQLEKSLSSSDYFIGQNIEKRWTQWNIRLQSTYSKVQSYLLCWIITYFLSWSSSGKIPYVIIRAGLRGHTLTLVNEDAGIVFCGIFSHVKLPKFIHWLNNVKCNQSKLVKVCEIVKCCCSRMAKPALQHSVDKGP